VNRQISRFTVYTSVLAGAPSRERGVGDLLGWALAGEHWLQLGRRSAGRQALRAHESLQGLPQLFERRICLGGSAVALGELHPHAELRAEER